MGNAYIHFGKTDAVGIIGGAEPGAASVIGEVVLVYRVIMLLALMFCAVTYVLCCLGVYTVARRRRIRNPWLAWFPVANLWVLGSISDQYQYLVKGRIKSRRGTLPLLAGLTMLVYLAGAYCVYLSEKNGYETSPVATIPMLLAFICVVLFAAGVAVTAVYLYICSYDLFRSCDPDNRKLFLVLSILYPVGLPFILFAIRKRDGGMPPRKQPVPVAEEPIEEPEETEEPEEITEETEGDPHYEQEIPVADA